MRGSPVHAPRDASPARAAASLQGGGAPGRPVKGRGAGINPTGRYEPARREAFDDGWEAVEELQALRTNIRLERPRTIITRNDSPDISFDRSINPYRGCEHGCVYCYARPSHAYLGLSPGLDFETEIFLKEGAAQLLERELSAQNYTPRTLALGANTDPYQPIERKARVTRDILSVLARANHPVGIVTKSSLVTRDIDLLAPMAANGLAKVAISVTTLDPQLARRMEPRAASPERRLETIARLAAAGIPTAVLVAPIIPGVNDAEIETILARAHAAGAREAGYVLLRLPLELKEVFSDWLLTHFPQKARRVLSLIRSTREGELNDATFGKRMRGAGPYAWMLGRRFQMAAEKFDFRGVRLRTDLFRPPLQRNAQLDLFS